MVIIDELEELAPNAQKELAFFVKQLGDQNFAIRFILVGIADSIHQLIGAHQSSPRYIRSRSTV